MPDTILRNLTADKPLAGRVVFCDTFWKRGRGLMFRRAIGKDEAYIFVLERPSVLDAAIHMFFVPFPIAVIWLDESRRVIHQVVARPWRPYYAPPKPARYFVEGHPDLLAQVRGDDQLAW